MKAVDGGFCLSSTLTSGSDIQEYESIAAKTAAVPSATRANLTFFIVDSVSEAACG
jgi:hypothetical protein